MTGTWTDMWSDSGVPIPTDSFDILDGVSNLIAQNIPGTAYNPAGTYTAGQVGVFTMLMPASPDACITLTWVPQVEHPSMPQGSGLLQVRCRGGQNNPRQPVGLLDQIGALFLGRLTILLSATVQIMQVRDRVRAPLGMDDLKRWDWTDNYTLDVAYTPTPGRPPGGNW